VKQADEQLPARAVATVGLAIVVFIVACVAITWQLVRPTPAHITLPPTTLEHGAYDPYTGSAQLDRAVEAEIDAVVADPSLIGGHK
jgi:hypothetical protein